MAAQKKKSFVQWQREIDAKVQSVMGASIFDLEDMDYMTWYNSGVSVTSAVAKVKRMVREEYGFRF